MATYVTGVRSGEREKQLEDALSVVETPDGVGRPSILFGTDHSGDAAVHIIYPVSTKIKLTKKRVDALIRFSGAVHEQIRTLPAEVVPFDVLPYVRFTETTR